ncbi:hypothetical protein [Mycobacteroides abscessus]|uniref:hypothetical protein n=1 Tax=Mycobacteroides abscessus TaxID=36809 RepID=UPI00092778D6|nr:hypothetical protein [Mycobacteroides abscessus]MBE5502472.1 hypothetical protein [Mycobacteroides abscessus]RIS64262.1 hypothetical protein D2E70_25665 [Mycobacteroides abscessus]SIA24227.1 Uncharacterised protein [Mycobacteroides abscessus subsp. abscessus]SKT81076.1 Uncharacterised protein [Mycobacteroides abscessus subsp. massiliense]SKT99037.1 Uncharacterised protein [Mycobacteroides abscessus subsp. massiliense]
MTHDTDEYDELIANGWAWSDFSRPVFEFATVLRDAELMPDDEDEYWEKPRKWSKAHQIWIDANKPGPPQDNAAPSLPWERFVRDATASLNGQSDH